MNEHLFNYAPPGDVRNCYESFQPPPLDLQSYTPSSQGRDQLSHRLLSTPSSNMFFTYAEEAAPRHHQPSADCRNPWQFSTLSRLKMNPYATSVQTNEQQCYLNKTCRDVHSLGMQVIHPSAADLNLPLHSQGGVFTSNKIVNNITAELQNISKVSQGKTDSLSSNAVEECIEKKIPAKRKNSSPLNKRKTSKKILTVTKRTRAEDKWVRNVRKKARSKGESYISVQGKVVPARSVKPVDCSKCKFNCPDRVTEDERQRLFKEYWDLENFKEKVDYIANLVHEFAPLRPLSGRRAFSRRYILKINGREERVCKEFFVTTFDISESTVVTYMDKKRKGPDAIADLRGKQTPSNKTPDVTVRSIREHILSQIGLQGGSFGSPKDDNRNVKKLYRHYQIECESENIKSASISVYRKVHADMQTTLIELPPEDVFTQSDQYRLKIKKNKKENCLVAWDADKGSPSTLHQQHGENRCLAGKFNDSNSSLQLNSFPHSCQNSPQNIISVSLSSAEKTSSFVQPQQDYPLNNPVYHKHLILLQQNIRIMKSSNYQGSLPHTHSEITENLYAHVGWDQANHVSESVVSPMFVSDAHVPQSTSLTPSMVAPNIATDAEDHQTCNKMTVLPNEKAVDTKKIVQAQRTIKESKLKSPPKKRCRNEESWGRNVRKKLRFKGQAYTSVRGKLVEAKCVKKVDCSKCKFKCTSRITEEQRVQLNINYWNLDTYKKKIDFLTKYVETYTPKRKMTGRRSFSRKYIFAIDCREERVCKDFFKSTLHISESTIATALEKSRKGPEAIVDMRGKHKPVNKTTEETLQNIRELIIYVTGMRPHRDINTSGRNSDYTDMSHMYQIYKYDCERKSKKVASFGIFRNVLVKEFFYKTVHTKKDKPSTPPQSSISS